MPRWSFWIFLMVVFASASHCSLRDEWPTAFQAAIWIVTGGVTVLIFSLIIYLTWEPVGVDIVSIQGRYLIPIVPCLAVPMCSWVYRIVFRRLDNLRLRSTLAVLIVLGVIACQFQAILTVLYRYYEMTS
jgi:uncharacterized membrane protein